MNESFMVHGANMDCNIDFQDISDLCGPDNLNFITNKSNNSSKNIHVINIINRYNKSYHTVCINTFNKICTKNEANRINSTKIITPTHKRWWLKVPVEITQNKRLWIRMLGDSAADKPCANFSWANKFFRDSICIDKEPVQIFTGGGMVQPKYCIWLSFPGTDGTTFSAKFVLLDKLPAPILADMNVLEEFGYKFQNEIPPVFRSLNKPKQKDVMFHHPTQPDLDIDLKEGNEKFKSIHVNIEKNWRNLNDLLNNKFRNEYKSDNDIKYDSDDDYCYNINNITHKSFQFDKIKCLSNLIYESDNKSDSDDWKQDFYFTHDTSQDKHILNCIKSEYKNNVIEYNGEYRINNKQNDTN